MKNIFKFMGIALMACSLTMVSCSKDDEKSDNNGGNGGNGGTTTESSIAVTWDGSAADIQYTNTSTDNERLQGSPVYMVEAAKGLSNDDYVLPAFITYFIGGSDFGHASEFKITYQGTQYNGNVFFPTEAYIDGGYASGENVYGDWQMENRTINSENFDATAMTINANIDFVMYDYADYDTQYNVILDAYQAGEMDQAAAQAAIDAIVTATKNMSMVITNFKVN